MLVKIGTRELEMGGPHLGELRECNGILDDLPALRSRMAEDGYLLIRDLIPRDKVLAARRKVFEVMRDEGNQIMPGTDLMDAVVNPEGKAVGTMGRKGVTHTPEVLGALEAPQVFAFFNRFFGASTLTFDYKWLRAVGPEGFTGAHIDVVYMGRGSKNLYTTWTPFGDIPIEQGTLCLCVGSHNLPGFEKMRSTYGKMDVDRDRVGGWFSSDPLEVTEKFGGQWQTTNVRAGDVIVLSMFTMHGSTNNTTNRWRLSCDTRFQPAADPVDERWVGENPISHYAWYSEPEKMLSMEQARAKWGV